MSCVWTSFTVRNKGDLIAKLNELSSQGYVIFAVNETNRFWSIVAYKGTQPND